MSFSNDSDDCIFLSFLQHSQDSTVLKLVKLGLYRVRQVKLWLR